MTNQEAFEVVARHLLAQGRQSIRRPIPGMDFYVECAYRGQEGTKCAIGCLIPDDMYNESMEGVPARDLMRISPTAGVLGDLDEDLLTKLQEIHDRSQPDRWSMGLIHWGSRLGMNVEFLLREAKAGVGDGEKNDAGNTKLPAQEVQ